jgi:hypothetical protein
LRFVCCAHRLDAVGMARLNTSSLSGLTAAIDQKATSPVYPQEGYIFCNIPQEDGGMMTPSPDGDENSADPFFIHVADVCHSMYNSLNRLQLKSQPIYRSRTIEPVNLYHKATFWCLEEYVTVVTGLVFNCAFDGSVKVGHGSSIAKSSSEKLMERNTAQRQKQRR